MIGRYRQQRITSTVTVCAMTADERFTVFALDSMLLGFARICHPRRQR